ncbi:cytochrome o ubiquinol oxidase subunit III [Sphingomonas oligoaromativorans]|uniref:cytochrome o ubiquinol oxidase subunit III n=1 Tax=Sphingomonas oligoaromativorans TaxID=575322 RepID=UPI0014227E66|nr:cytochrome o ubiquinol oxidase subunit III [Sphingomonas oligoaromativorans]NIJ34355.1 cytochrome o ubiquinol oxidase subunit 3 [Sphingomonas oligoaromativorans]
MTSATITAHGGHHDHHEEHHDQFGTVQLGFWVYLMSDCVIFSGLFATYAVMSTAFAGGPTPHTIFDLPYVAVETALLLFSSITYGFAMIGAHKGNKGAAMGWLVITALFGLGFIGMEVHEFAKLIHEGAGPDRSGWLSSFFALVGTHGLHVTSGLVWMTVMLVQVARRGLTETNIRRLTCLSLFWHFLDVIWIGVFSLVYLMGVSA